MDLKSMRNCAADTLDFFIKIMPGVPFTGNDIIIAFAPKDGIAAKYIELKNKYAPERIINDSQIQDLSNNVFADALTGRETSAVVVCIDTAMTKADMRRVMFHEFMHIFCAKTEMDGGHFIDVYGTGTTRETEPFDEVYDGILSSGYALWSEFIANYYAVKYTENRKFTFRETRQSVESLLYEITNNDLIASKDAFSYMCSYLLNCTDIGRVMDKLSGRGFLWDDNSPYGAEVRQAFQVCAEHIQANLQTDMPWKITEEYISILGEKFMLFRMMNSLYLSGGGFIG